MRKEKSPKKSILGYSMESVMNEQRRKGPLQRYWRSEEEEAAYMEAIAKYNKNPSDPILRQRVSETMNP